MMLNDHLGCCTICGAGHAIQGWSANASKEITISDNDVLSAYETWDGYNPKDPSTDTGGIELNVLNNWRTNGLANHKLFAFAAINIANQQEVKQAINLFGGAYIGVSLPLSAQEQGVWDVDLTQGSNSDKGSWGGHCVYVSGYDEKGVTCITWGILKKMTWDFWKTYCDEAYALFGQEWLNTGGQAPSGFNHDQLIADLSEIR
jgi:hypothetical protein